MDVSVYDPIALRDRAQAFRSLAQSWTALAAGRPLPSAEQLRVTASAALFAAWTIDRLMAGTAADPDTGSAATAHIAVACARTRDALERARRIDAQWPVRTRRPIGDLRAQLQARKRQQREFETDVEWLEAVVA